MSEGLRCCEATSRVLLKNLYEKSHDSVYVERCASCGANWFHRWHEMIDFDGGDDSVTDCVLTTARPCAPRPLLVGNSTPAPQEPVRYIE